MVQLGPVPGRVPPPCRPVVAPVRRGRLDPRVAASHASSGYQPARQGRCIDQRGRSAIRFAAPLESFARGLARALEVAALFARITAGRDALMMLLAQRLLPAALRAVTALAG